MLGGRTLVQPHRDNQDADQRGPDRLEIDEVQPYAKAVLIHSVHTTGKSVRESEAGMHTFRLDGDQNGIISTRTIVVIAPVERFGHTSGASTPRKSQPAVGRFGTTPLPWNLEARPQSLER